MIRIAYLASMKRMLGWLWALPITLLGLAYVFVFSLFGWYSVVGLVDDSLVWQVNENKCPEQLRKLWSGWLGHTVGNVVVLRESIETNPTTFVHEAQHVRQCMRMGIFQPIAYGLCLLFVYWGCPSSNVYYDNPFEIDARRGAGQVVDIRKGRTL